MAQGEAPIVPTKLTEGNYTRGNSSVSVDNTGKVTVSNWAQSGSNALILPVDKPIPIKNGDEIVFALLRKSGSPGWKNIDINLNKSATAYFFNICTNLSQNLSTNNSITKASTVSGDITYIHINNRGNAIASSANYSFAFKMTINGKVVLE